MVPPRAGMDDPGQELYNTAKRKLLDGRQVFSQTITQFDVKAYCEGAQSSTFRIWRGSSGATVAVRSV